MVNIVKSLISGIGGVFSSKAVVIANKEATAVGPVRRKISVSTIRNRYSTYPSYGLTPERLASIFKDADQGDILSQSELFEEMEEKDAHLGGLLQTRKLAVQGLDWEIQPATDSAEDKKIAEAAKEMIQYVENWEDGLFDMLDALGKGFSVCEIMWEITEGMVWAKTLEYVHQKRFTYNSPDVILKTPRLITDENPVWGEELLPDKFIIHTPRSRSGIAPRGGLLRPCAWMFLFKNYDIKSWMIFNELYSVPMRIGKYAAGTSDSEIKVLKDAVFNLGTDAAAVVSDTTIIELLESKTTGQTSTFTDLADFCDKAMSKAVLGHAGSAEGTPGKLGNDEQADNIRRDILEADAKALMKTIKFQLLAPWVRFNYGPDKGVPVFKFHYEEGDDLEKTARVYGVLVKDVGFDRIGIKHIQERFNIPELQKGEEAVVAGKVQDMPPAFKKQMENKAVNISDRIASSMKSLFPDQAAVDAIRIPQPGQLDPVTSQIITMMKAGSTYDDIMASVITAYPALDMGAVELAIQKAIYVNDLWGGLNA